MRMQPRVVTSTLLAFGLSGCVILPQLGEGACISVAVQGRHHQIYFQRGQEISKQHLSTLLTDDPHARTLVERSRALHTLTYVGLGLTAASHAAAMGLLASGRPWGLGMFAGAAAATAGFAIGEGDAFSRAIIAYDVDQAAKGTCGGQPY
jgi:hypothetical protein